MSNNSKTDRSWTDIVMARALFVAARYREIDVRGIEIIDEIRYAEARAYDMILQARFPDLIESFEDEWNWEMSRLRDRAGGID